jgi:hypothetical protein
VANEVIKKVRIASAELPFIQFTTTNNQALSRTEIDELYYDFRYRIISQDKNRTSSWSAIERIVMPDVGSGTNPTTDLPYFPYTTDQRVSVSEFGNPKIITAIWTKPLAADNPSEFENIFNKINIYDVWVRWTEENNAIETTPGWTNWEYVTTVSSNTFSIAKPQDSYKTVEVAIQIPTDVKLRDYNNNKLTLFKKFGAV